MTFRKQIGDKVVISDVSHKHHQKTGRIVDIRGKFTSVLLDETQEIISILLSNLIKTLKK